MDRIYNILNLYNIGGLLGSKARAVIEYLNTWFTYSSEGENPQTWQAMETGGSFQREWQDLV